MTSQEGANREPSHDKDGRETEHRLVFEQTLAGIAILRDHRVERCNQCLHDMLGYAEEELVGQSTRLWHADDIRWVEAERRCAAELKAGRSFHGEMSLQHKDGGVVWCAVQAQALDPNRPDAGAVWVLTDATARRAAEFGAAQLQAQFERRVADQTLALQHTIAALQQRISEHEQAHLRFQRLAHFDPLTNLPNRALLTQSAEQAITHARAGRKPLAVLFLDLDRFKYINDSLGHRVGDELLAALAARFKATVRERDTVSRLGGDEFMLVLPDTDVRGAAHVAEKLIAHTTPPFQIGIHELNITPSIGIAMYPLDGEDFSTLTQCADAAMYQAKRDGRSAYRFFTQEMQAEAARALSLENALRRAIEREQLHLYYQPMVDLRNGQVSGVEALLRWRHPDFGNVTPTEFIPVAEACGLVATLGEWVLRGAARQLRKWRDLGLPPLTIAVNLSAMQLLNAQLPELVSAILQEENLGPEDLELELTEGAAMEDPQRAIDVLEDLHARGVRVSIDDFGTGYSSLSYLKRFRAYKLKIDQSFVRDISADPEDRAIVGAIIHMAGSLGLRTIAEGVETEAQLIFLRQQGCDEAQGYLFSRPLSAEQLEGFVRDLQQT